jgi:hypothetical protein
VSTWWVRPTGAQDRHGVLAVVGLADDLAVEFEGGVGGQQQARRQLAPAHALDAALGLGLATRWT